MARDVITRPVVAIPDLYLNCTYYVDAEATWEDLFNDLTILNGSARHITDHLASIHSIADDADRLDVSSMLFSATRQLSLSQTLANRLHARLKEDGV